MSNVFSRIGVRAPGKNWFNLSHDRKFSASMGKLIPILVMDTLPGDKFNISTEILIRFSPLVAPVMHDINVFVHYFFVPNRLVWNNWENFISPPEADSPIPAHPYHTVGGTSFPSQGSLTDYLGVPIVNFDNVEKSMQVSSIPFAGYQKIYNEYYRDQNLIEKVNDECVDGNNSTSGLFATRYRSWMHDYFTAALPFAQKGQAVSLPLISEQSDILVSRSTNGATGTTNIAWDSNDTTPRPIMAVEEESSSGIPDGPLFVDGDDIQAQATTINDLRRAIKLQEFLEKQARGGSRYIEQIRMHFNVKSSDARLQRPEFLGGTRNPVIISEVLQTSSSDDTSPQATMAGHGLSASGGKRIKYFCEEHGYIFGIMSVMPKTAYQQGLPKHFHRFDPYDYAWPTFAHIGEQPILNEEIYVQGDDNDGGTFGYIPRYSEYRYIPSSVHGDFRTNLAFWHLGRIFENPPQLNQDFIECKPRTDIFAVEDGDHLWCHAFNKVRAQRALPKYGSPLL